MKFSDRVYEMQFSPIRKFNPIAIKAEEEGKKVYHFNIGQPDVETPDCFMDAIKAYNAAVIKYAESGGITTLQDSVIEYFKQYGMDFSRDDMIVTNGGSEALTMAFLALVNGFGIQCKMVLQYHRRRSKLHPKVHLVRMGLM